MNRLAKLLAHPHAWRSTAAFFCAALLAIPAPLSQQAPERVKLELKSEGTVEVQALWRPFQDSVYKLYEQYEQLQNFAPAKPMAKHETEAFRAFLPPTEVAVGDTWRIDPAAALPFLRQIHPGATAELHHGYGSAPGGWACLRVLSRNRATIQLRVHAEFVLVKGDDASTTSTLTPAQFAGTLEIDRKLGSVEWFELAVPDRNSNVDVNVPMKAEASSTYSGIIADIGYIPRMKVLGGELNLPTPGDGDPEKITVADAEARLAKRFYPFAAIEWLDLPNAARAARERKRPLHVVLLFGSLDDESC